MPGIIETVDIDKRSKWVRIETENNSVEGKLHRLEYDSQKLIIFEPGFPGDGSSRLEKLWLDLLLKNNFTVFAIRHSGTIINGPHSATYLNCPERQELARKNHERLLGDKDSTIADWLLEPLIALKVLAARFDEIYLVGHSFGGLAIFYSLIEFAKNQPNLAEKVKRIVSLAGSTGKLTGKDDPILRQWSDYLGRNSTRERLEIGDPDQNLEILERAYKKIHNEAEFIPESIEVICVMVENDELVPAKEADDIINTLGRGYFILDTQEKADEDSGRLAHDMDNLPPQTFLNLVSLNWKPENEKSIL